ncbi:MAG: transposase [Candidatus Thiodiazotropha sp. (ex Dulcina madagascariensis)]|nr:transposase [Candidatus Thiodiazotropha sp. (ex Dulcina madagascariensis)]MCU7929151.1 transposase [Candidatus Thiodiazotropha sp. (ex Dulcina madagascariensis)]
MPKPRKALISLDATPYYHCVSRCVRRAWLCGEDPLTGHSFEHRRQWIQDKLFELAGIFAIDVCSYAVLSNHFHLVLFIDQASAKAWETQTVIELWHCLYKGSLLSQRYLQGESLSSAERQVLDEQVALWRSRLMDISWFMRCLNESIAREANREDGCTGRFWEGRFKSQALLDEKALAACMAYVDLNPVRAGLAQTPEQSEYTAVAERSEQMKRAASSKGQATQPAHLLPFVGNPRADMPKGLPFRLIDYLELLDWTGRAMLENKHGHIPKDQPPILERLQIDPKHWLYMTQHFESKFKGLVGTAYTFKAACQTLGYRRTPNLAACQQLLT